MGSLGFGFRSDRRGQLNCKENDEEAHETNMSRRMAINPDCDGYLSKRAAHGRTALHGWIGEAWEGPTLKNLGAVVGRLETLRPNWS